MKNKRRFFMPVFFAVMLLLSISAIQSTAYAKNTKSDSNSSEASIQLNIKKKSLVKKSTYRLRVRRTSSSHTTMFRSSNPQIVSIKKSSRTSALIRARKVGSATIEVAVFEGDTVVRSLSCKITVTPSAFSVRIPVNRIVIHLHQTYALDKIMVLKPKTTVELPYFFSYNPTIASISPRGVITAKQPGTTIIKASLANGKSDTCKVIVKKPPRSNKNQSKLKKEKAKTI